MSVAELRQLLDKHRVPHKDCIEKAELIFRAQQALRANETVAKSKMKEDYDEAVNVSSPQAGETGLAQEENHRDVKMENSSQHRNNAEEECQRPPFDNAREPAYETLNEPTTATSKSMQKDIPSVFQSMVEPPPPPPPQAPAPHPYFKDNIDSNALGKESHKSTENLNEAEQDEVNPEDQKLYPEKNSENIGVEKTSTTSTNYTFGADHTATTEPGRDAATTSSNVLDNPQIRMKIELRKSQEEFESQQRATARIQRLKSAELEKEKIDLATQRHYSRIEKKVKRWSRGKSLIRMLTTMHTILPSRAPKLSLNLRSTADDVKIAYKKALRTVHPDKLISASMSDRMKAEQVFKALRDAYTLDMQVASEIERKEKEATTRASAYYRLSKKFSGRGVGSGQFHGKVYHSQRWE